MLLLLLQQLDLLLDSKLFHYKCESLLAWPGNNQMQ